MLSLLQSGSALGCNDIVYMLDKKHKYAFLFTSAGAVSGSVLGPAGSELHKKQHEEAFLGKKTVYQWHSVIDGKARYFNSVLTPLLNAEGRAVYVLGIVRDITDIASVFSQEQQSGVVKDAAAKTFAQALLAVREEERKNLTSALHDELGSTSVMLNSMVAIIEEDLKEKKMKAAMQSVKQLDARMKESLDRLKAVVVSMRPPNIDAVGLEGAVHALVDSVRETNPHIEIKFNYEDSAGGDIMSDSVKIMLYRVVQESLNNALKHSAAHKITIKMQSLEKNVKVNITDNGKGFNVDAQRSIKNIGLLGMIERVKYLGGKFEIKSALGKGTQIEVTCPKVVYTTQGLI